MNCASFVSPVLSLISWPDLSDRWARKLNLPSIPAATSMWLNWAQLIALISQTISGVSGYDDCSEKRNLLSSRNWSLAYVFQSNCYNRRKLYRASHKACARWSLSHCLIRTVSGTKFSAFYAHIEQRSTVSLNTLNAKWQLHQFFMGFVLSYRIWLLSSLVWVFPLVSVHRYTGL